ncbi:MAG TPA: hypothetical protein VFR47_10595 [Anaerolineales bacterium]|nr:hypothetical protein [Anaerolineales bacterium]
MKKLIFRTLVAALVLQVLLFDNLSAVRADETNCPPPTNVNIDIKPGNSQNKIKLSSRGILAVAVLTTQDFDASQFTPEMAHLSDASIAMTEGCTGALAQRWSLDDENGDGRLDLVFFFKIQDLNLALSSTAATLMAHGSYAATATHIVGTDSVQVVP